MLIAYSTGKSGTLPPLRHNAVIRPTHFNAPVAYFSDVSLYISALSLDQYSTMSNITDG